MFPSLDEFVHAGAGRGAGRGAGSSSYGAGRGRGRGYGYGSGYGAARGMKRGRESAFPSSSAGKRAAKDVPMVPVTLPLLAMDHESMADLSRDQRNAAAMLTSGKNVFVTGHGGCGKTHLIQCVVAAAAAAGNVVEIAATTGIAAQNITKKLRETTATAGAAALPESASTLHGLLGMAPGKELRVMCDNALKYKAETLRKMHLLIVDEISMFSAEDLSKAIAILRHVRGGSLPVLMLVGDFLQLGPVNDAETIALESRPWVELKLHTALLRTNFRQQHDPAFAALLSEVRLGRLSSTAVDTLQACVGRTVARDGIEPTELQPFNAGVDAKNMAMLAALPKPHMRYVMEAFFATWSPVLGEWTRALGDAATPVSADGGGMALPDNADLPDSHQFKCVHMHGLGARRDDDGVQAALRIANSKTSLAPVLTLAVGAQIVFTVNVDPPRIVNGTRGRVEAFDPVDGLPIVRLLSGELHKVLPSVHTHKMEHGMRVPLASATSASATSASAASDADDDEARTASASTASKSRAKTKLVTTVAISQLPIRLAFALTVHRAQGMTLELGNANLGSERLSRSPGIAYVALSRFPGFKHFALTAFTPACVCANPDIVAWYEAAHLMADAADADAAEKSDDAV
jgi:hypothetical protein